MPLAFHEFLKEIQDYKERQGLMTNDDDFRKRFWIRPSARLTKKRKACNEEVDLHRSKAVEKPTRVLNMGSIVGVGPPLPLYINRGPAVAREFQGARSESSIDAHMCHYPPHLPNNVANYLAVRMSLRHRSCLDVPKDSATLWRDLVNSTLDNKMISKRPRWYHPMVSTAREVLEARWPRERKKLHCGEYFEEYLRLFDGKSLVFVPDWRDEQCAFRRVGTLSTESKQREVLNSSTASA